MGKVYGGNNNGISCDIKAYLGNSSSVANDIKVYMGDSNGIAQEIYNPIPPFAVVVPRAWGYAYQNSIDESDFLPDDPRKMGGTFIKDYQYTVVNGERRYTKIRMGFTISYAWTDYMRSQGFTGNWQVVYHIKSTNTYQSFHGRVYYGGVNVDVDFDDNNPIVGSDDSYHYYTIPSEFWVEVTPVSGTSYFTIPSGGYIDLLIDVRAVA